MGGLPLRLAKIEERYGISASLNDKNTADTAPLLVVVLSNVIEPYLALNTVVSMAWYFLPFKVSKDDKPILATSKLATASEWHSTQILPPPKSSMQLKEDSLN
jgi:hypothetical protein